MILTARVKYKVYPLWVGMDFHHSGSALVAMDFHSYVGLCLFCV